MIEKKPLIVLIAALLLSGCVGTVVKSVVTAPFKAAGAVVDAATTSQAEADRNRGRDARKADEQEEKYRKKDEKKARKRRDE
jgi:ribosomal protein L12E/L44/L45/RPP1/RPP2